MPAYGNREMIWYMRVVHLSIIPHFFVCFLCCLPETAGPYPFN